MDRSTVSSAVQDRPARQALAAIVLAVTNFLVVFDGLVVTVALPAIQRGLGFDQLTGQWVITAYTVALGGTLLAGGRCGDRFGQRRTLTVGLAAFGVGLVCAAVATAGPLLLASRTIQGLGAGLAVPNTYALISHLPSPAWRRRAFAASGVAGSGGSAGGAVIGGLAAQSWGWRSVFLLGVPLVIGAIIGGIRALDAGVSGRHRPLNIGSAVLAGLTLVAAIIGITGVEQGGGARVGAFVALGAMVACGAAFVVWERRSVSPLVSAGLLRLSTLRAAVAGMPGQVFAYNGTVYLAMLYFQEVRGYGPARAGLAFAPLALAAVGGGPLAARLMDRRIGWTVVVAGSLAVAAAGLTVVAVAALRSAGYAAVILPGLVATGAGVSVAAVTLNAAAGRDAPPAERGAAYGMFETSTHVAGAIAVAVLATVLTAAAGAGFVAAFLTSAACALLGGVLTMGLGRRRRTPAGR